MKPTRRSGKRSLNSTLMNDQTTVQSPESAVQSREFAEARELQWTWKTPAMEVMTVAICTLAIERGVAGEFSANDLPEFEHGGQGICGSIFRRLVEDGVLARVGSFAGATFVPKIVTNAGGNMIKVYRLASHARATTLVRIHSARKEKILTQASLSV